MISLNFSSHSRSCLIPAAVSLLFAAALFALGVLEISFPDLFSWSEVGFVSQKFPSAWKYGLQIGIAEVLLGALLIIPAFFFHRSFAEKALETLIRFGIGGMFIFASVFKIADPKGFAILIAQYQFLPENLVNLWALILPQFEFWCGIALIITPFVKENTLIILALFASFMIALVWALALDLGITCGCFQIDGAQSKSEAWVALIRDLILLFPTSWLLTRGNRSLIKVWRG
ncbi:hypothetical protein AGMMS49938_03480 [Fibrobacterales bacterium]|nr:hypothetical protein AGMMS49938_03480 [Fibrobacterales bacterium]